MNELHDPFEIDALTDAPPDAPRVQAIGYDELAQPPTLGGRLLASPHPLHGVKVRLQVSVGEAVMSVGELMAARENQVLVLDRAIDEPVDLLIDGQVVARGMLVAVDGCFAVQVTELPLPLKL